MKPFKFLCIIFISICSFQLSYGQTVAKTESIVVNGNCSMCKKNIEKSALSAGATAANWDKKTKFLSVSYDPSVSNSAKIQTAIAGSGYDTQDVTASDSAYYKLDECCQYERKDLKDIAKKKQN